MAMRYELGRKDVSSYKVMTIGIFRKGLCKIVQMIMIVGYSKYLLTETYHVFWATSVFVFERAPWYFQSKSRNISRG